MAKSNSELRKIGVGEVWSPVHPRGSAVQVLKVFDEEVQYQKTNGGPIKIGPKYTFRQRYNPPPNGDVSDNQAQASLFSPQPQQKEVATEAPQASQPQQEEGEADTWRHPKINEVWAPLARPGSKRTKLVKIEEVDGNKSVHVRSMRGNLDLIGTKGRTISSQTLAYAYEFYASNIEEAQAKLQAENEQRPAQEETKPPKADDTDSAHRNALFQVEPREKPFIDEVWAPFGKPGSKACRPILITDVDTNGVRAKSIDELGRVVGKTGRSISSTSFRYAYGFFACTLDEALVKLHLKAEPETVELPIDMERFSGVMQSLISDVVELSVQKMSTELVLIVKKALAEHLSTPAK